MKCMGGPMSGQDVDWTADVVELGPEPDMAYHRTLPSDWTYEQFWWEMGLPEPVRPEKVYEWHEREWIPPVVRALREAVIEASDRLVGV